MSAQKWGKFVFDPSMVHLGKNSFLEDHSPEHDVGLSLCVSLTDIFFLSQ